MLKLIKEKREQVKSSGNAGFTLMEMIIVIAIIGALSSMLMPRFTNYTDKTMGTTASSDTRNILTVAISYALDNSSYPTVEQLQGQLGALGEGKTLSAPAGDGSGGVYTYEYTRAGATITSTVNAVDGQVTHVIDALSTAQGDRINDGLGGVASGDVTAKP